MRMDIRESSDHVRHNATQSVSISSYVGDEECRICDSWDVMRSDRLRCKIKRKDSP